MRKNNWIVTVIVVVCGFLLWLWYSLGFNRIDSPVDIVVAVIWWIAIALVCVLIVRAEKKRRERMRTAFVGKGVLWGAERGVFAPAEGQTEIDVLMQALSEMEYPDEIVDFPEGDAAGDGDMVSEGDAASGVSTNGAADDECAGSGTTAVSTAGMQASVKPSDFTWVVHTKKFKIEEEESTQESKRQQTDISPSALQATLDTSSVPAVGGDVAVKVTWEGDALPANDPDADPITFLSREELEAILDIVAS